MMVEDGDVKIYGSNKKEIERAKELLSHSKLFPGTEQKARDLISKAIDEENLKVDIVYKGNVVWNEKRLLNDFNKILKNGMESMTDYMYKFLSLETGSIAHYDKAGWISTYPTLEDLFEYFMKNEFGNEVVGYSRFEDINRITEKMYEKLKHKLYG